MVRRINIKQIYTSYILFIIALSAGCLSTAIAQDYKFDHLASENRKIVKGLSQNWIYDIMQDHQGYLWFATWYGLNKYDGYNFTIYTTREGLSDNTINCIYEDEDHVVWIGTNNGLNRLDQENQQFKHYFHHDDDSASIVSDRITAITQSADGYLWIGTTQGLSRMDRNNETFQSFFTLPQPYYSPRSNYITDLFIDELGTLWISTTYGLITFSPKSFRSIRYYAMEGDKLNLSHNNVRCVMQVRNGDYWIGTIRGLNIYDKSKKQTKHYFSGPGTGELGSDYIRCIYEDKSGKIWIGTHNGGLYLYLPESDSFLPYKFDFNDPYSLSNNQVYDILEDHSGNLWVGTFSGISLMKKHANDFNHVYQQGNNKSSLSTNIIWAFEEDQKGRIWIGTDQGINIFNPETKTYQYITANPENVNALSENDVRALDFDKEENTMWIGTRGGGLNRYDFRDGSIEHFQFEVNKNSLSNNYVNDVLVMKGGQVWIATANGLNILNVDTKKFNLYGWEKDSLSMLSSEIVICLLQHRNGNIWAGTNNGIARIDPRTGSCVNYCVERNPRKGNNSIFNLAQDNLGRIWAGTSGKGLFVIDPETGGCDTISTENGLPNNTIYGIVMDQDKNMWITTNYGLSKYFSRENTFVNYDIYDGIQSNEFNLGAVYKAIDGKLFFGGMNGYNAFYPEKIITNKNPPPVVISSFRIYNERVAGKFEDGSEVILNYDDNFISIEIAALDFTNTQKNKYKYKLENFDKNWTFCDASKRVAEYKKISPGTYVFKANGTNNDGIWGKEDIELTIVIKPPWWNTLVFKILLLLILIASIWYLIKRRVENLRKRHQIEATIWQIEKQKIELEKKALRLQMNPHFIFNSLNSIQGYILKQDRDQAIRYLSKFSKLMRLILTNSSSHFVLVKDEIKALELYLDLEKLRFENKFEHQIIIDPKIDQDFYEIPPMIIQPYVENAIIHGLLNKNDMGSLIIDLKEEGKTLVCTITDNGIGREKAREIQNKSTVKKKSVGMEITRQRLQIINKQNIVGHDVEIIDLKDQHGKAAGTKVIIRIVYRIS